MHAEALRFAARAIADLPSVQDSHVLEIGSRDLNGSIRPWLATAASYTGIDRQAGQGVDVVADGATYVPVEAPDLVVCMETLEHAEQADAIVRNAAAILRKPGGRVLITCATEPRAPHSAIDGGPLRTGEFYRNVSLAELVWWVEQAGLKVVHREVHMDRGDLYLVATA
jgi:SAM-dependent methyltransferase